MEHNDVLEEKAAHENVDTAVIGETLDLQPAELGAGEFHDLSEESCWQKGWRCPRRSDAGKNLDIKGILRDTSQHCKCKG